MINKERLFQLAKKLDVSEVDFLRNCIKSFEDYHCAVFNLEMYKCLNLCDSSNAEEYRETVTSLDRTRTICHNSVIANVSIINRMAQRHGMDPIYDGIVSEDRPHRRVLADAVFAFVEDVIKGRA